MATTYIVFREVDDENGGEHHSIASDGLEANNAEQACRRVADTMHDDELAHGVTLIAVPARNWTSGRNTFKAETRRRLLRS